MIFVAKFMLLRNYVVIIFLTLLVSLTADLSISLHQQTVVCL